MAQGIVLSAIGAGLGVALRRVTTFSVYGRTDLIVPTAAATLVGILGHLLLYYILFRPRLQRRAALLAERIRLDMGLPARVLQGGITEEVQFRWGFMSLATAVLILVFPPNSSYPFLLAVAASALLFAWVHLLGARQSGMVRNRWEAALIMVDNSWAGIVFGWLLWKHGLLAAMISHALFHVVWFPIEMWVYQSDRDAVRDA